MASTFVKCATPAATHLICSLPFAGPSLHRFAHLRRNRFLNCCTSVNISSSMSDNNVTMRVEKINGHMTEVIEFDAENPKLRIVFIPGNPGIVSFYQSYIEALSQLFNGEASITAISHIGHTSTDWHDGKLFSLEEQIEHKIHFLEKYQSKVPLFLVGHSIGAYIALCIFKQLSDKVQFVVGLYPFLAINTNSSFQALLRWSVRHNILRGTLSHFAGLLGKFPENISKSLVKVLIGRQWSPESVNVACRYLLQYSVVDNFSYMGMTEFKKLQAHPDWTFLKEKEDLIYLLFGEDDHWGPLTLFEEISKQIPSLVMEVEKSGFDHAFCCTEAGSSGVALYSAKTIKKILGKLSPKDS